jgi:predicted regulator of Ras-like GTPase activity (Roadblock/LC7/MglB family)
MMGGLREIIQGLDAGESVRGAAIIGEDGLVIHDALVPEADGEAVAALAVATLRHAEQLGGACRAGELRTAVFEFGAGPAILASLAHGATLVVLAQPDRDLGPLLYELRTRRDTLTGLL